MMADDRDWDRELAKIDKLMGAEPAPPPPVARPAAPPNPAGTGTPAVRQAEAPARPASRPPGPPPRGGLRVWAWTLLGPLGVVGLGLWPYSRSCGALRYGLTLSGVRRGSAGRMASWASWAPLDFRR